MLELVEGPALSERIGGRQLPIDEVIAIGRQIAEALGAAHEANVIHRDLKPANIKVTPEGVVKILDFGLAKVFDIESDAALHDSTDLSTASPNAMFGTAAYMSPEQVRRRSVDQRADIWAFGCVLFEMLTGTRAFPAIRFPTCLPASWSASRPSACCRQPRRPLFDACFVARSTRTLRVGSAISTTRCSNSTMR